MRLLRSSAIVVAACSAPQRASTPACGAETVVSLRGQDDVEAAAGCLTIAKLSIRTGAPLDLAPLAKLHVILGELSVGPSVGFEDLRLPELHSVGAMTVVGNGNLHGVFFPKLTTAGSLTVDGNVALTTLSMPRLSKVRGDLVVRDGGDLELVELSSLVKIEGALRVEGNPKLTLLELGKLERVREAHIENNKALAADVVDALRAKAAP